MLSFKYGLHEIAIRNMELVVTGVIQSSIPDQEIIETQVHPQPTPEWEATMDHLSANAYARYHKLIYEDPTFLNFFEQATPILELGWLNIGSVPHVGQLDVPSQNCVRSLGSSHGCRVATCSPVGTV